MKTLTFGMVALVCMVLLTGCFLTPYPAGILYSEVAMPWAVTDHPVGTKVGRAESQSYFGLVAMGDSSIEAAMRNGGIERVSRVDLQVKSLLGAITTFTTVVYGE